MVLTAENYYSQEANEEYMSVSQFKDFCGTYGKMPCEFTAMEKLKGRWEEPKSKALMVGSYVDSYFEGTLDKFKAENPDLFKRDGTLKAEFVKADEIIQRIERDDYFMKFMSGKKQVIMTGELFGTKWKIKMDSYIPDIAIVDLKVMASITKLEWVRDIGYVRYMDDVIILSSSKAQLQEWKVRIASFLETELELQLNNKTCIRPINQGIEFVGYRVWPDKVVLRKKTTLHIKRVLKAKKEAYRVKEISFKQATDTLQSYLPVSGAAEMIGKRS